ncbi:hypothetical protein ACLOJK_033633 [Asimina triloba]
MAAAAAKVEGARLNHISRATSDPKRLANFYQQVLGFERIESPELGFQVIWLKLPKAPFALHIIEKNPLWKLPEGPSGSHADIDAADAAHIARGHHLCFDISNYDSFIKALKATTTSFPLLHYSSENGVKVFETKPADGKTRQAFFFDPDDKVGVEKTLAPIKA